MKQILTLTWWLSKGYRGKLTFTMLSIVFGMVLTVGLLTLSATVHSTLVEQVGTAEEHLFMRRAAVKFAVGGVDVKSGAKTALNKLGLGKAADSVLGGEEYLNEKVLDTIRELKGVSSVHPEVWSEMPAMIRGKLPWMKNGIQTDLILLGVDPETVSHETTNFDWQPGEPIPILVPKSLIIAYNTGYATANGYPKISESEIVKKAETGLKIKITVGRSSTNWQRDKSRLQSYQAKIVGVTTYGGMLAGIVPYQAVQHLQKSYKDMMLEKHDEVVNIEPDAYTGAMIVVDEQTTKTELEVLRQKVKELDFDLITSNSTIQTIAALLKILDIWISITGLIILISGGIALAQVYRLLLSERQQDLKILRYFGATLVQLITMLSIEILSIACVAIILGTILGVAIVQLSIGLLESYATKFTGLEVIIEYVTIHQWTYYMGIGVLLFIALLITPMLMKLRNEEALKIHK